MSKDCPLILLSATPMFDKVDEFALTMNLLRLPKPIPTGESFYKLFLNKNKRTGTYRVKNLNKLQNYIRGFVSYYRGAAAITYPKKIFKRVECRMSPFQYKSYISVLAREGSFKRSDIFAMPNNFFMASRSISNIAFPNKKIGDEGFISFRGKWLSGQYLKKCSNKFYQIIKRIKQSKGPVFVYSNFKETAGIASFVRVLQAYGYSNYSNHGVGEKTFAIWSGDQSPSYREEIKTYFNKKENKNGRLIKVFIGSPAIKEGVSLFRVEQVHLMEPYWNISRMEQIIGRAVRYCSHKDMPSSRRKVYIYMYESIHPKEKDLTIDTHIYRIANRKNKIIKKIEKSIKEIAVDCELNINANNDEKNPLICR